MEIKLDIYTEKGGIRHISIFDEDIIDKAKTIYLNYGSSKEEDIKDIVIDKVIV